jgi:carboxylesterase
MTDGVLLIHGLGGTHFDLGGLFTHLKRAGFETHTLTLPGHGTQPEDLGDVVMEDWVTAVRAKYAEVKGMHPRLHIIGMCMGALLACQLAKLEQHHDGKLVLLAPTIYLDGWSTPWYRLARHLHYVLPWKRKSYRIEESEPFGIKNERLRAIVKSRFGRGESFHYPWTPLQSIWQLDRLARQVKRQLHDVRCPTLIVHARDDELTSLRSAQLLLDGIGQPQARLVVLENSYHMVCIDNNRDQVAHEVLGFLK